jgi:alcohol dehydrogenase (cytochrome c)
VGNINIGETLTGAPIVIKDKVIVGNSGGELGVRGYVVALDVDSGKEIWRAYNSGPDADVKIGASFHAFYAKDQGKDLGATTWRGDQWKLGGGTVWGYMSYDPETNLFFYGTGNPGVWNADLRPGDNKWSSTIFARDPDTGEARWATQVTAHDAWDYDEIMENVLLDMPWGGTTRKLLVHPGRTGFVYVLDRTTGEMLSAETFEPVTWASGYDLKTGKPNEDPKMRTHNGVVTSGICPSSTGGKDFIPSAFSPRTGLLYIPAHNTCMDYEGIEANYIAGTPYLGADVKMYPGPGGYQGELVAWDVAHAKKVWGVRTRCCPSTAACSRRVATSCSTGRSKAGSSRSTHGRAPNCGSSTPARASSATRSRIAALTASSTSPSIRVWAAGWAPWRFRPSPPTTPTPVSAWSVR